MATAPHSYRDLNAHHAEIEGQPAQAHAQQRQGTEQEVAAPEHQHRSDPFTAYLDGFREHYGKDAHITPEHESAARRALGKDLSPEDQRQELADVSKTHGYVEQARQASLQQEADRAREVEKAEDKQAEVQPQSGYQSFIAESEPGKERAEREQNARHAEFVSRLAEKSSAQREREQGGNEV